MSVPDVLERLQALLASRYVGDTLPPPGVNKVPNGSFEHDTVGQPAAGWTQTVGASPMVVAATTFTGSAGAKAANIGSSGVGTWSYQTDPVDIDEGVALTARARFLQSGSASQGPIVKIQWLDEDGVEISRVAGAAGMSGAGNGSTGACTAAGTPPAGAVQARVIVDKIDNTNVWWGFIDAVMLAPTAQGSTYADGDTAGWAWGGTPGNSVSIVGTNPSSDQILDAILGGIADGAERLGLVAFGDDTIPPAHALTDPSVAPDWALPHASLYTSGGLLPGRLPTEGDATYLARARDAAVYPLGIKAGTNEAIVRTVQPLLTGTKTVIISVGADPYVVVVRTLPAETPSQSAVSAAIMGSYQSGGVRGALRAEMGLDYTVSDSPQFAEATRTFLTVTATATATNVTRTDVT